MATIDDDISTIESVATEFTPPPRPSAVLTVGTVRFVADLDDIDGETWFRNRAMGIVFVRHEDGSWYCGAGSCSATAPTPAEALGTVLHEFSADLRDLTDGGVSLEASGKAVA